MKELIMYPSAQQVVTWFLVTDREVRVRFQTSKTEQLLERKKKADPVQKTEIRAVGIRRADHVTPSILKSWH
jgi:hypothetical protein